jgi:hypothetical protein
MMFTDFDDMIRKLKSLNPDERRDACINLGEIGNPLAVEPVMKLLDDPEKEVRKVACIALGNLGSMNTVEPLIKCLEDSVYLVRFSAVVALGKLGDNRAVEPLIECLRDGKRWVRHAACEALGKLGDKRAVEPLIERLDDSFDKAGKVALIALEKLGEGPLAAAIAQLKYDDLIAFAKEGDSRPVDPLVERLETTNIKTQDAIKKALVKINRELKSHADNLLCKKHFARFALTKLPDVKSSKLRNLSYYACRICKKASNVIPHVHNVTAVLDSDMSKLTSLKRNNLRVNYLKFNELFDFERIEIVKANIHDVKLFLNRIKRDTDEFRQKRYRKMACTVKRECKSEEILASLREVFENVRVK